MQFKHPEILYFLALLILPILVHLFQLQRFVKTPFTNVAFLQKLANQTRKSSRIKKWLILATRLLTLSALIFAFTQPYFSNNSLQKEQQTFIYLDNSLSTKAKGKKGELLKIASQEIIENFTDKKNISLLTNTNFHQNSTSSELKNILLKTENSGKKANFNDVLLKISNSNTNQPNETQKTILVSDFQNINIGDFANKNQSFSLVKLSPEQQDNILIDSVFINQNTANNFNVQAIIKNIGPAKENLPIAIYNKQKLISKQTFSIDNNGTKTVVFSIQKVPSFLGKINIAFNDTFNFDNSFYFTLHPNQKINVLAIGNNNNFLSKLYGKNEFNFASYSTKNINYNQLKNQQLIIVNNVENIPKTLQEGLVDFSKKGGNLVVIPSKNANIQSYNSLLKNLSVGKVNMLKKDTLKITKIHFSHPLLKNVFDKKVNNFQYPSVQSYFTTSFKNTSSIVSFENNKAFIQQIKLPNSKLFWVNASLDKENSNFTNSPLIVPVFYNIGQQSLQVSKLYYRIDETNTIDVDTQLGKDAVLSIGNDKASFIPLQKSYQNKITLTTKDNPLQAGFYHIIKKKDTLQSVAYNYPKEESSLNFLDVNHLQKENPKISVFNNVAKVLQEINEENKIHWLWQWFLALAIVFLLLEILILKYFKV